MVRVLLCDDAVSFSVLFGHWMRQCEGVQVVATTDTPEEAVSLAGVHQADVIVLDHMLRSVTSDALVPQLRAASPASKILLISAMSDEDLAAVAAVSRVDGCMSKTSTAEEICLRVRSIAGLDTDLPR